MNENESDLHRQFMERHNNSQWKPTDPQSSPPTREQLRADLREALFAKTGSAVLADLSIEALTKEAVERRRLVAALNQELVEVDTAINAHLEATASILAPYRARLEAAQADVLAAAEALEKAQRVRYSELANGPLARKNELLAKLRGTEEVQPPCTQDRMVLQGRLIGWRAGGAAPQFPGS